MLRALGSVQKGSDVRNELIARKRWWDQGTRGLKKVEKKAWDKKRRKMEEQEAMTKK